MNSFDTYVSGLLLEDEGESIYPFNIKKVFYVQEGMEEEFKAALQAYIDAPPIPLPNGLNPRRQPLFQLGPIAGEMADSRMFAGLILDYYNTQGEPLKLKDLLRNAQVRPNEIAMKNLFTEIDNFFGEYLDYKLPFKKPKEEPEPEPEEPGPSRTRRVAGAMGRWALKALLST